MAIKMESFLMAANTEFKSVNYICICKYTVTEVIEKEECLTTIK